MGLTILNILIVQLGTVFVRQNLTSVDRLYTSESDVHSRQILTYKNDPRAERVNVSWPHHWEPFNTLGTGGRSLIEPINTC